MTAAGTTEVRRGVFISAFPFSGIWKYSFSSFIPSYSVQFLLFFLFLSLSFSFEAFSFANCVSTVSLQSRLSPKVSRTRARRPIEARQKRSVFLFE